MELNGSPARVEKVTLASLPSSLLNAHRYLPYRSYRLFSRQQEIEILRARLRDSQLYAVCRDEGIEAVLAIETLDWDTEHLGWKCAQVAFLLRGALEHLEDLDLLLSTALEELKQSGVQELRWELDCEDAAALGLVQKLGFRVLDTKLTYLLTRESDFERPSGSRFEIRSYRSEDREQVLSVARERFSELKGRFGADLSLPKGKSTNLYLAWLQSYLKPDFDGQVKVACRQGKLVGFLAYRLNSMVFGLTGCRILGRGLSAVKPGSMGAYVDLLCESIVTDYESGDAAEFETSISNPRSFSVFEALGFRLVRSAYALKVQLIE